MRMPHDFIAIGLFAALWWLLGGGQPASWVIGLPAVLAAFWWVRKTRPPAGAAAKLSLAGLLRFLPYFLWESLRGGVDVALRTLSPRMRIHPGFALYRTCLRQTRSRVFFANCVSLLPGTLAADLQPEGVRVHLLDARDDPESELRRLESAVGRLYCDCMDREA